jgi:hypothetical protein
LTTTIIFNIFNIFLSISFIDIVLSFFDENFLFQITITLQKFLKCARREICQQIKNVYSYDFVINQINRSFYHDVFSAKISSHLLCYFFQIISIQISISTIKKIKQRRVSINLEIDLEKMTLKEKFCEHQFVFFFFQLILKRQTLTKNYLFFNTMCKV